MMHGGATFDQLRTDIEVKFVRLLGMIKTNKAKSDTKGSSSNESNQSHDD